VFDNIPLTALALKQGGHDWGYLAYAVAYVVGFFVMLAVLCWHPDNPH
jgi:hypothetical protein